MAKYKFEQFKDPIEDPEVSIKVENVRVNLVSKTFFIDIVFPKTEQAVYFELPIISMDLDTVAKQANEELKKHEI